jgi:hypothetical protein
MNRGALVTLGLLLLLALVGLGVKRAVDARRPQGTDAEQIRRLLYEAERAAERRDASGVNRYISDDYDDGTFNAARARYAVMDYLRSQQSVEINIPSETIHVQVDPDGRTATADFRVQFARQTGGGSFYNDIDMSLRLQKEPVHYYVLFPGEEWRIVRAEGWHGLDY